MACLSPNPKPKNVEATGTNPLVKCKRNWSRNVQEQERRGVLFLGERGRVRERRAREREGDSLSLDDTSSY